MTEFMDRGSRVFSEEAFSQLLTREADRATRYQEFFSLCLLKPDASPGDGTTDEGVNQAVSRKIAQLLRSADIVGQTPEGIALLLLNTPDTDALLIAERIRAHIEAGTFELEPGEPPRRVTLSMGLVSFPRDGSKAAVLFARAHSRLQEAARGGGNRVVSESSPQ